MTASSNAPPLVSASRSTIISLLPDEVSIYESVRPWQRIHRPYTSTCHLPGMLHFLTQPPLSAASHYGMYWSYRYHLDLRFNHCIDRQITDTHI